ncbi:hypothetical protein Q5P01_001550 [Channa striata]|uniref:Testis expressed 264, ER-phagy receptor n=1 Tax=Channa striata TaxID=64152 RepID=A0AA88NN73_CHASR|nr:hypothetical protein Q5P01_001550 [Channa striata]
MPDWLVVCAVISLLLSVVSVVVYSGLLADVTVLTGSPPIKKITFAYKFKQGPYRTCGQLFREALCIGPKLSCIGVFYDNPKKVPGPQCRFAVGSILSEGENKPDVELLKRYETSGFNVFSFPEITHVVTTSFPHKTFFSILLKLIKVYPQLQHYIKERRLCAHPFLEIYKEEKEESHSDTEVSGADSNSEYSSGSGVLLTDSRESSPGSSSVHSVSVRDQGDSESFKELDWEHPNGQQEDHEEQLNGDSNRKNLDVPAVEWWGVVGGEE